MNGPTWVKGSSTSALTTLTERYKSNLKSIAESLARHDRAERVLEKHVISAADVLDAFGHSKKPWYQRHELEIGIGGIIFGWAASVDDWFAWLIPDTYAHKVAILSTLKIACFILGPALILHGMLKGRGITAVRH